ncbi:MAG: AAA family ATPase [Clostridiales bacterium]|jgi:hypothetical protein|nr:AAA family ATPase [Clostridiales bacterium]
MLALNSSTAFALYSDLKNGYLFIDKSLFIEGLIKSGEKYICVSRPRRFGKTLTAAMIDAFLNKGVDSRALFGDLGISKSDIFETHLNKFNVIRVMLNTEPDRMRSHSDFIENIDFILSKDLLARKLKS